MDWLRAALRCLPWCSDLRPPPDVLAEAARPWDIEPKLTREDILSSDFAVVVFSARWEGSWRHYLPIVRACAEKYDSQVKVGFFDVDSDEQFVRELKLANVPTTGFFRDGQVVAFHLGYNLNLSEMAEFLVADESNIPARIAKQQRRLSQPD